MSTEGARGDAYADLVSGLLDARIDHATERFDTELAAAVTDGSLTPEAARTLRFWQRASVRAVVEHARNVLPAALGALDVARTESRETIDAEGRSWDAATEATGPTATGLTASASTAAAAQGDDTTDTEPSIDLNQPSSPSSRLIVAGLTQVTIGNEPAH